MQTVINSLLLQGLALPSGSFIIEARDGEARTIPVQLVEDGPIVTMKESDLQRRVGGHEDDNELAVWVEYRLNGRVVHRSAHVHLKKAAVFGEALAAALG